MTSSYYGYNSGGGLLEVADQCASIYYGTATYCVGTNALVSSAACSSGSSFVANANIGGKLYLLPSIWSIASQQCLHQPLVPSSSICSAVPTSSRVTCGDLQTAYDLSTCQSTMGCCWDTTSSTCFHSDSQSVFPTGAPFIPHINRIECTFTDKTACINGGCAWHNSSAGAIAGPSCYRKDVFRQVTMLSTTVSWELSTVFDNFFFLKFYV